MTILQIQSIFSVCTRVEPISNSGDSGMAAAVILAFRKLASGTEINERMNTLLKAL